MAGRLRDKVAVVTGAAPRGEGVGNGMATAILFAREGAKVVLVNRNAERADKLARQIKEGGGEASVFAGDVTKADAAEAMAEFAVRTYGRLDILHNNVGIGAAGTPETVTEADWHKVLEANLTSTMLCTRYCLPRMKAGGGGQSGDRLTDRETTLASATRAANLIFNKVIKLLRTERNEGPLIDEERGRLRDFVGLRVCNIVPQHGIDVR